jgi:thioester reductase-like protein
MDRQVKVRGFRIELGEVETVAATAAGLPCVADVDASGQALWVFVEAAPHDAPDPAVLYAQMALRLPPQMLPQRFVAVEQFPHTPSGKIDRAALRRLGPAGTALLLTPGAGGGRAAESDTEKLLADIWQDLLGLDQPPGAEEDFFLLGGHSLLATKLVFRVRDAVGVEVPLPVLFSGELTIAHLAEVLQQEPGALEEPTVDLAAEVDLDPVIRPPWGAPVRSATSPRHLLLTGATGFVGSFLLGQLLETTEAVVSCLVRAGTPSAAMERIRQTMTGYGIWREEYTTRVRPVLGTLDQPRLGLSPQQWQELASEVDVIFHSGATVNFLRSYESLKAANVTGTQEVLRLATDTTVKPVQYVSSLSVFSPFAYPAGTVFGEQSPEPVPHPESMFGYVQTKWVAEQLVFQAQRRGVPVNVFRTGHITGHSQTGACQQYDFIWQAVRLGIRMGIAPVIPMKLDLTPVDYVVDAIAYLGQRPIDVGRTYHVVAPEPLPEPDLVSWMESYGYRGQRMSFAQWSESVVDRAINLDDDAASALAPFLSGVLPLDQMPVVEYDAAAAREDLEGSGIRCHPIDETLLRRYCDWFVEQGYFDPPSHRSELLVAAEGGAA